MEKKSGPQKCGKITNRVCKNLKEMNKMKEQRIFALFLLIICTFAMNELLLGVYQYAVGSALWVQFVHSKHFFLFPKQGAVIILQPLFAVTFKEHYKNLFE